MSISTNRIHNRVKERIVGDLTPRIKSAVATQKNINVSDLVSADWTDILNNAVEGIMNQLDVLTEEIITEIRTNAEIDVPPGDLKLDSPKVDTIVMTGTFSQGAGAAAVPNPAPVPLSGNVKNLKVSGKITKGNIK